MASFRKAYQKHDRHVLVCPEETRTEQHHREAASVTNILKQYDKTGILTNVNQAKAMYGDFTEVNEYQESLNLVIRAQDAFDEMPSDIRKRFHNDPGEFLEFVTNPDNQEEMVTLGLATKIQEPAPTKVEVINQPNQQDSPPE
jgi:phage internal scaffolding protein